MIIDAQNLFSDDQALTATAVSTNVIDLGIDRNVGIGEPMAAVVTLSVAADDADADETYVVTLETDDNSSFSSATVIATATILKGAEAGSKVVLMVPADETAERYLRINYTLGGTSPSMTVKTFLQPVNMIQNNVVYADAITIS